MGLGDSYLYQGYWSENECDCMTLCSVAVQYISNYATGLPHIVFIRKLTFYPQIWKNELLSKIWVRLLYVYGKKLIFICLGESKVLQYFGRCYFMAHRSCDWSSSSHSRYILCMIGNIMVVGMLWFTLCDLKIALMKCTRLFNSRTFSLRVCTWL